MAFSPLPNPGRKKYGPFLGLWIPALFLALGLGLLFAGLSSFSLKAQDKKPGSADILFFRIGTGATSGAYFPIGGLLASAISNPPGSRSCEQGGSCGVEGLVAVAQSTDGSLANADAIAEGRLESGFVQADIAHWAYSGDKAFKGKSKPEARSRLRAIANLFAENIHIVVGRDSGITRISDLKGKRVSLGEAQSGTRVAAELILKAYGLKPAALKAEYLSPEHASEHLRTGNLDAFFLMAGSPVGVIADLAKKMPIALVSIDEKESEKIRKGDSFFAPSVIPPGLYQDVAAAKTLSVGAQWLVSVDVADDLVYALTRQLWNENVLSLLAKGPKLAAQIRPETALEGITIPLHPGAERYYREIGKAP